MLLVLRWNSLKELNVKKRLECSIMIKINWLEKWKKLFFVFCRCCRSYFIALHFFFLKIFFSELYRSVIWIKGWVIDFFLLLFTLTRDHGCTCVEKNCSFRCGWGYLNAMQASTAFSLHFLIKIADQNITVNIFGENYRSEMK